MFEEKRIKETLLEEGSKDTLLEKEGSKQTLFEK